jgi:hypothetical protein
MTTFDTTTQAERDAERAAWKAAVLVEHLPDFPPALALAIASGRVRLSFACACRVRFAVIVAAQIHHDGKPTQACACRDCAHCPAELV